MKLTKEMLIDWIDRPPSNSDLDLINYIVTLQNNRDKAIRTFETLKGSARWETHLYEVDYILDILKGDSDD